MRTFLPLSCKVPMKGSTIQEGHYEDETTTVRILSDPLFGRKKAMLNKVVRAIGLILLRSGRLRHFWTTF